MTIPKRVQRIVTLRANGICEYCQTQQLIVIMMNVDHIKPVSAGGATSEENLCLSCPHCNQYKADHQESLDPDSKQTVRLFNPRMDSWLEHFRWSEDFCEIIGLTPIGRATVNDLRMNDPLVVRSRKVWVLAGLHPPQQADSQ